jgi:negative regulator of flagellin synthesis FlgM
MKIGNSADQAAAAAEALRTASDTGKTKAGGAAAAGSSPMVTITESTKVELSGTAAALAIGDTDGVFDADKVARVQDAIANGSYVISPQAIASKLIANARELLQGSSSSDDNG